MSAVLLLITKSKNSSCKSGDMFISLLRISSWWNLEKTHFYQKKLKAFLVLYHSNMIKCFKKKMKNKIQISFDK